MIKNTDIKFVREAIHKANMMLVAHDENRTDWLVEASRVFELICEENAFLKHEKHDAEMNPPVVLGEIELKEENAALRTAADETAEAFKKYQNERNEK